MYQYATFCRIGITFRQGAVPAAQNGLLLGKIRSGCGLVIPGYDIVLPGCGIVRQGCHIVRSGCSIVSQVAKLFVRNAA